MANTAVFSSLTVRYFPFCSSEGIELVGEPLQLLHALRPAGKVFRGQCASTQLLPPLLRQRLRLIRPADQGLVDQLVAVADRPVRRQAGKLAKLALRLWQINRPRGRCRRQARYRSGILGDRNGRQVGLTQRQPSADGDTVTASMVTIPAINGFQRGAAAGVDAATGAGRFAGEGGASGSAFGLRF
ncbi:Uncharacterised protein [Klebsiella pneumoniae]|nr:Uncharacterised protein [Klebsiella pneumoniae]